VGAGDKSGDMGLSGGTMSCRLKKIRRQGKARGQPASPGAKLFWARGRPEGGVNGDDFQT